MPYLGNTPSTSFATVVKDTFNGGSTGYTLSKVATTNSVSVFVENVRQEPTTAYSVSGTTLTFTATTPSGTGNIYVLHMNPTTTTTHPAAQNLTAVDGTFTGNIDVDGTANLDVVDIDGAVDMASTLAITGDTTLSRAETDGTVRLNLSNTGSNGSSEYSEIKFNSTAGSTVTSIVQHRNNSGMNIGTTTDHPVSILQNNAAALTVNASGDIDVETGDIFFSTAGKGINLGVTSNTNANTLDDYEEGTWTPTFYAGMSSVNFAQQYGHYIKIGQKVTVTFWLLTTSSGNTSDGAGLTIQGLPFTVGTDSSSSHGYTRGQGVINYSDFGDANTAITLYGGNDTNRVGLGYNSGRNSKTAGSNGTAVNSAYLIGGYTYFTGSF